MCQARCANVWAGRRWNGTRAASTGPISAGGITQGLIHAGGALYHGQEKLYSEANDERSRSWQFGENLYILDGKALLVWDGETVQPVTAAARVPVLTIARPPTGGGTPYEDLNLLQQSLLSCLRAPPPIPGTT